MIQEIAPHRYDNHYEPLSPSPDDRVFLFSPPKMLAREGEGREIRFPRLKDFARLPGELIYLFSIDGEKFFLAQPDGEWEAPGFSLLHTGAIRGCTPPELSFAAATAMQLSRWYRDNRFCGRCGGEMARDTKERMLYCPRCKNTVYPKISPCIITGITDGDRILLTKYARSGYNHYALVAGFCEIGESFEETLRREVAEEVGLEVENIRYWNSQPWSFSDSLLAGFFCDVRGSRTPRLVDGELKEASWFSRAEIPVSDDGVSLTRAMIEAFRQGKA
mgnify:FL=1